MVHEGRRTFLRQFKTFATAAAQALVTNPADEAIFRSAQLDRRQARPEVEALHRSLIALRRSDPVIAAQRRDRIEGAVFNERAFVLRWLDETRGDRLLVVNLGEELTLTVAPEPLLAPPVEGAWAVAWSSDEPRFGGPGAPNPCEPTGWRLPGESAVFLIPAPVKERA
jgi:maltooligosyltrehalose trehalohydrolase